LEPNDLITKGQIKAQNQLKRLEALSGGAFRIISFREPPAENYHAVAVVQLDCSDVKKSDDGLPLRSRENFKIFIPPNFPFSPPSVNATHKRFCGFPHVQWVRHLCLYLSPETEWNISDGMYGFVERLHQWLIRGATNSHELDGQPLHPPVAYNIQNELPSIITQQDTPAFGDKLWIGFAILEVVDSQRTDLVGWQKEFVKPERGILAPAVLFKDNFPFEYPNKAKDLFTQTELLGVSIEQIHSLSLFASVVNNDVDALYFVVGTPMRGVKGEEPKQHLSVWSISEECKRCVLLEIDTLSSLIAARTQEFKEKFAEINARCRELSLSILKESDMRWCTVKENRPEIAIRRDSLTPAAKFLNKTVAIWGCGAIGSYVAEILARSGVSKLTLRDNKKVSPGILVRQNFEDRDIGKWKTKALKERLEKINSNLTVDTDERDISRSLSSLEELKDSTDNQYDFIFDATASARLHFSLEYYLKNAMMTSTSLSSAMISSKANSALVTYIPSLNACGIADVNRKSKIHSLANKKMKLYSEEFWPTENTFVNFQPEPGCSDPTFIGSSIDMMILVGRIIDSVSEMLASQNTISTSFIAKRPCNQAEFRIDHEEDMQVTLPDDYQVRLTPSAIADLKKYISKSKRYGRQICETGGLLYGQIDHASEVVWISEVTGPPKDSISSPEKFICGTKGTREYNKVVTEKTQGSVSYIGMWHTHPISQAKPSVTDLQGMAGIMLSEGFAAECQMLMIVGFSATKPELGLYKFSTSDLEFKNGEELTMKICSNGTIVKV
tara:strand:+ start:18185 stop:20536 length:2352 start_codon:yes stop_codon:yes gene_type:complete